MYEQIEKPKKNKSRLVVNSVAQKKSNGIKRLGFVDNRKKRDAYKPAEPLLRKVKPIEKSKVIQQQIYYDPDRIWYTDATRPAWRTSITKYNKNQGQSYNHIYPFAQIQEKILDYVKGLADINTLIELIDLVGFDETAKTELTNAVMNIQNANGLNKQTYARKVLSILNSSPINVGIGDADTNLELTDIDPQMTWNGYRWEFTPHTRQAIKANKDYMGRHGLQIDMEGKIATSFTEEDVYVQHLTDEDQELLM